MKLVVNGDIGCYTLAPPSPWRRAHHRCMGASIGVAHGVDRAASGSRTRP